MRFKLLQNIFVIFLITLFINIPIAHAEVTVSDTFSKTVQKLAKNHIKTNIIHWIETEDPVAGIIAGDLMDQLIDQKSQEQIVRSTIKIMSTMIYLNEVLPVIDDLISKNEQESIDSSTTNNILTQANKLGWNRDQLIKYTALGIYFNRRYKENYTISPFIKNKMEKEIFPKLNLLYLKENSKWIIYCYQPIAEKNMKEKNIRYDFRAYELLERLLNRQLFSSVKEISTYEDIFLKLNKDYNNTTVNIEENKKWLSLIATENATVEVNKLLPELTKILFSSYIHKTKKNDDQNKILDNLQHALMDSFIAFSNNNTYTFFEPQETQNQLIESLTNLFKDWLQSESQMQKSFSYQFLLSGTWIPANSLIDFTVQDQFRLNWDNNFFGQIQLSIPKNTCYLYAGGIIDPILKKTILKDSAIYYPVGFGIQYDRWNICFGFGIPFNNLNLPSYKLITIGYEIPFWEIEFEK